MPAKLEFKCPDLNATRRAGADIAALLEWPACVYLVGEMGAGKTTLCQAIIGALGYQGAVTSPTYNLIQEYPVERGTVFHIDLYRLNDPQEADYLGLSDLSDQPSLLLIEWPQRAAGRLPAATQQIFIDQNEQGHRQISLQSC
ncbi:MAG: tRNA (adenosine(37)-N6)-threonylcarbamoyltransferase complex ATPase subunit type 1 TsaE [Gammaproteobacteria bacterium]|nr:tRNA (adenosine(37)-N6)-threonylcarbamoyltransferase complex ATPase subunit type 1 TsaE [Gammaproteobacteria bacterium]